MVVGNFRETLNENLADWDQIDDDRMWNLLVGNGLSVNVDTSFSYTSLFQEAQPHLSQQEIDLFNHFGTTNFEEILRMLKNSSGVAQVFNRNSFRRTIEASERNIRAALITTIEDIHPVFLDLRNNKSLLPLRRALRRYHKVFTTNYDIIPYWSIIEYRKAAGFVDYFWGDSGFDRTKTKVFWSKRKHSRIFYLHGAIHLFEDDTGCADKISASGGALLAQVKTKIRRGYLPLFITEGSWKDKVRKIRASEYLNFAFTEFRKSNNRLVIFGQSLNSNFDQHLIDSINDWGEVEVAISIYPGNRTRFRSDKIRYQGLLPYARLAFFDSTTHPLGDSDLGL